MEEHFYLLLLALLMALATRSRRAADPFRLLPGIFAAVAVACLVLRWYAIPTKNVVFATHLRLDSLFAGVTLGYLYHFRRGAFQKLTGAWAALAGLALCSPALFFSDDSHIMQSFGLTGLLFGFSLIVAWAVDRRPTTRIGIFVTQRAAGIGLYSYSIYLWHTYAVALFVRNGHFAFWVGMSFALLLGYTMATFVEVPFLRLRQKVTSGKESKETPPQGAHPEKISAPPLANPSCG